MLAAPRGNDPHKEMTGIKVEGALKVGVDVGYPFVKAGPHGLLPVWGSSPLWGAQAGTAQRCGC